MGLPRQTATNRLNHARALICGLASLVLVGCSTQSAQGPTTWEITHDSGQGRDFLVLDLSSTVLQQIAQARQPSLVESFGNVPTAPVRTIEKGDIVAVAIWDVGGGLFAPQTSVSSSGTTSMTTQQTVVPNQTVDPDGTITVPFAGHIRVAGKSTIQAQQAIMSALAHQALQPQALVTVVQNQSNLVTVIGDVKVPNRLPLDINGMRLLDAVARAGGASGPAFDEIIQLSRRNLDRRVRLSQILSNPNENIYLQPDDTIYVLRDPETVTVLGATTNNARLQFDTEHMTLAEAVGLAGGLRDIQAEPSGVFVFRVESSAVVGNLKDGAIGGDAKVPVVFKADLRTPQGYFLAQSFQIQDKDIVYVANAETTQLDKIFVKLLHAAEVGGIIARDSSIGVSSN